MSTLGDLVNEVHLNLLGYVLDQESITTVTTFDDNDTSFTVADATQISSGLIEVDEELMWCTEVDPDANIVTVSVRGMYGTTAASHSTGAVCRNSPRFPRQIIVNAINATLRASYPDVFAIDDTTIVSTTSISTYEVPADVEQILQVTYDELSPSGHWSPIRRWDLDMQADTTEYTTGKSITIFEPVLSGRNVRVTYIKQPTVFAGLSSDISTTGLEESVRDMLIYGACSKLVGNLEPARISDESAQANLFGTQSPGAALAPARYFYQLHLQARAEEARRLQNRYPTRIHWNR
jgi:hypothetical protein